MKDTIFYSRHRKDTSSPKLFQLLERTPFANSFLLYCVDPDKETGKRNDDLLKIIDISQVPTLVYQNEKYVGEDAFHWVREMMMHISGGGGGDMEDSYNHRPPQQYQHQQQQQHQQDPRMRGQEYDPRMQQGMAQDDRFDQRMASGGNAGGGRMPVTGMGGMVPGMALDPRAMGLGNESMPPSMQGNGNAGSETIGGLQGGSENAAESYANPFQEVSLTGRPVDSQNFLQQEHTKSGGNETAMDHEVKQFSMMRAAQVPNADAPPTLPGMGTSMSQMGMQQRGGY